MRLAPRPPGSKLPDDLAWQHLTMIKGTNLAEWLSGSVVGSWEKFSNRSPLFKSPVSKNSRFPDHDFS